jgi:hypothetical protein
MKDSFPQPAELKGAVQGTLLYIGLFIIFIQFQAFSKFYLLAQKKQEQKKTDSTKEKISFRTVKYYNSVDALALNGDRTVGNFVEFAFVFLSLLWLHAIFVNPSESFTLALLYTIFRGYYPVVFAMGIPYLLLSTVPAYFVLTYMAYQLTLKVAFA